MKKLPLFKRYWKDYKFHLHPIIKLGLFFGINILGFLPNFKEWRWIVLLSEIFIAILIKLDYHKFFAFFKFILYNLIPIYLLFYFIDFSWISALVMFIDYFQTLLVMFLAAFLFYESTPPRELMVALRSLYIPKPLALGITVGITFLPVVTNLIQKTKAAQEARGYQFRIWRMGPILIPTILNLMDLSMNLAISLEARGFEL